MSADLTPPTAFCRMGEGAKCCAFLMIGSDGLECAKGTELAPLIRRRLAAGTMTAKGDNCTGPPTFTETPSV